MALLLNNSAGKPSASFTMMIVAFTVTMLWYTLSIVDKIGPFQIRQFSSSEALSLLVPLYSLYFGRRYTDTKQTAVLGAVENPPAQ